MSRAAVCSTVSQKSPSNVIGISHRISEGLTASVTGIVPGDTLDYTAQSKTYGQLFTPNGSSQFSTGAGQLVNGNTVGSVALDSAGYLQSATVVSPGPTYPITPSAAVGTGLDNYAITYAAGVFTVGLAHLTVTADNAAFDKGVIPSGLTAHVSGFVNGETLITSGVKGTPGVTTSLTGTTAPGTSPQRDRSERRQPHCRQLRLHHFCFWRPHRQRRGAHDCDVQVRHQPERG